MKRFPSIKKNSEFQHIYRSGASYANRLLVMYIERNGEDGNRIGISVSKKVGNSIVRHHITRLLREIFRLNNERIETGLNIVLVARGAAKESDYRHLEGAYMHLCGLHHILKESK
ncbi:ribonuclease P protein component [Lacrimispora sp. 210928-DFI.3.58]|mgnify:CR=1 FL=1|uniref:ribonuclease P protein component n=1 Tax=Lacrimispora sp. 210928-DFI.3.58 TaxID=2883214 RepID=UPI0015B7534E|nr:ribonuclease P protein component [Lacrimispora sp. 210928-DFI.3.58]MCB7319384.1 ribonuclease P protein component [Lacrimispora sp. 210928-DFI.3.58]